MFRSLLLVAALCLVACAAAPEEAAPDPDLAFGLGVDLTCDAGDVLQCPAGGCGPGQAGEASTLYISLLVPNRGGGGRFCIGSGCEDAEFAPTLTRAPGWTAIMRTNDRTAYAADLEIARDLRTFTLRNATSDGLRTWTGTCSAAGS